MSLPFVDYLYLVALFIVAFLVIAVLLSVFAVVLGFAIEGQGGSNLIYHVNETSGIVCVEFHKAPDIECMPINETRL